MPEPPKVSQSELTTTYARLSRCEGAARPALGQPPGLRSLERRAADFPPGPCEGLAQFRAARPDRGDRPRERQVRTLPRPLPGLSHPPWHSALTRLAAARVRDFARIVVFGVWTGNDAKQRASTRFGHWPITQREVPEAAPAPISE